MCACFTLVFGQSHKEDHDSWCPPRSAAVVGMVMIYYSSERVFFSSSESALALVLLGLLARVDEWVSCGSCLRYH